MLIKLPDADDSSQVEITDEDRAAQCIHCGGWHARKCPRIVRMEFQNDGERLKTVEYAPVGWEKKAPWVTWPEDLVVPNRKWLIDNLYPLLLLVFVVVMLTLYVVARHG